MIPPSLVTAKPTARRHSVSITVQAARRNRWLRTSCQRAARPGRPWPARYLAFARAFSLTPPGLWAMLGRDDQHSDRPRRSVPPRIQREAHVRVTDDLHENPREHCDWRRHRHGCPNYRERWFPNSDPEAGEPMYQVFCFLNTPPASREEQDRCLASRTRCWRLVAAAQRASTPQPVAVRDARRPA